MTCTPLPAASDVVLGLGPWSLVVLKDKVSVLGPGLEGLILGPGLGLKHKVLGPGIGLEGLVLGLGLGLEHEVLGPGLGLKP